MCQRIFSRDRMSTSRRIINRIDSAIEKTDPGMDVPDPPDTWSKTPFFSYDLRERSRRL